MGPFAQPELLVAGAAPAAPKAPVASDKEAAGRDVPASAGETHAGAAGVFGYSTGFTLGLPEQDVSAPVLSGTKIDMVTAGVTAGATA